MNWQLGLIVGIPALLAWALLFWMAVIKGYDRHGRTWEDRKKESRQKHGYVRRAM